MRKLDYFLLNQSMCCTHQRILGFWISLDFELVMQSLWSPFVDSWTWAPSTPRGAGWFVPFGSGAKLQRTTELWCICSFTAQPHRGEGKGERRYQIISPLGINLIYLSKYSWNCSCTIATSCLVSSSQLARKWQQGLVSEKLSRDEELWLTGQKNDSGDVASR